MPNDVKKEAIKAAKRRGINVEVQEIDSDFVGKLTIANPIYDYVSTDGEKIPVMAGYGLFKQTDTKTGETVHIPMWRMLPFSEIRIDKVQWCKVGRHDIGLLMHYPEYHKKLRYAKLSVLYLHVKSRIVTNIALEDERLYDVIPLWIIGTHFSRVFDHFPILDLFKAGYNAGGSIAIRTIMTYCSRPMLVQDPTGASLYRFASDFRPTAGIEEFSTDMDEEKRNAIMGLLDGSFDKHVKVPRTDKGVVSGYDLMIPKIVVDPQALISRYSTITRTFFVPLVYVQGRTSDPDILIEKDKETISTLYDLFFTYSKKIDRAYRSCKIVGDGRLDQTFRPLLAVALVLKMEGVDVVDSLIQVLQNQFERRELIKSEGDVTKQIIAAIYTVIEQEWESVCDGRTMWFRKRSAGTENLYYIRTSNLRNAISNIVGMEFQSDTSKNYGTRYWKRPPKEVYEVLQDSPRFGSIVRTFLPEFVANIEPGSRHLCLFFKGTPEKLKQRLIALIGFDPAHSHSFPHVGYSSEPHYSIFHKKKNIRIPQLKRQEIPKRKRQKGNTPLSPEIMGKIFDFFNSSQDISISAANPTCGTQVG